MQKTARAYYWSGGKRGIIRIGKQLCTLTPEDIEYIMLPTTTLAEAERRLYTANRR